MNENKKRIIFWAIVCFIFILFSILGSRFKNEGHGKYGKIIAKLNPISESFNSLHEVIIYGDLKAQVKSNKIVVVYKNPATNKKEKYEYLYKQDGNTEYITNTYESNTGEYIAKQMINTIYIRNGETIFRQSVLNDVVVHGAHAECIGILAKCDDVPITHYAGDGIIVATPTGSTAYSMSSGGPIVEPDNENILVTPICPHTMTAKAYVLLPTRTVVIEPERIHDRPAILSADGNEGVALMSGDRIQVKRSDRSILLVETGAQGFFERAFDKLSGYGEG